MLFIHMRIGPPYELVIFQKRIQIVIVRDEAETKHGLSESDNTGSMAYNASSGWVPLTLSNSWQFPPLGTRLNTAYHHIYLLTEHRQRIPSEYHRIVESWSCPLYRTKSPILIPVACGGDDVSGS